MQSFVKTLKIARGNRVESLDLSFQSMTELPSEIAWLASTLTELDLVGNRLEDLPSEFSALTSLTNLKLAENRFTSFPASRPFAPCTGYARCHSQATPSPTSGG